MARLAVSLAVASSLVCSFVLGTRTLTSLDLGYHLSYGEHALKTGELVDHDTYLYTLPPGDLSPSDRPTPGPGSWYDERGRYRFANANWLSQIAMAAVYRWSGFAGLCSLTAGLVVGLSLLLLRTSRRLELSWAVSAAALLGFGLVGYSRLNLRPELFGYFVFAAELAVLGPTVFEPKRATRLGPQAVLGLAVMQLLFVNLHSYWVLGLFVVGAIFFECSVKSIATAGGDSDSTNRETWRKAWKRSALLLFAMLSVSFFNPWTWRLAGLPFETLAYLREHQIGGVPGAHPWSYILEFQQTLHAAFPDRVSDYAVAGLMLLAGLGSAAALVGRRWAASIVLLGMSAVALSMKRNVAPAALVVIPLGFATLRSVAYRVFAERFGPGLVQGPRSVTTIVFACGIVAASTAFAVSVATNRFYLAEGHPMRFGIGVSRANLPIGAAHWLDAHLPEARVWCDMGSCSTLLFFTTPHREVPISGNTWAYPPSVMAEMREVRSLQRPLRKLVADYDADVVVVDYMHSPQLFRALARHPNWELVHVEGRHVTFGRLEGSQAEVVRARSLAALTDVAGYVARQRQLDPSLKSALLHPGVVYLNAGLGELAVETFTAIVGERPEWSAAWNYLGLGYLTRARQSRASLADTEAAMNAFRRALELDPEDEIARGNLEKLSHGGG